MKITREQYEDLNKLLNHYYEYALKNMEQDKEGRLKENYSLGVYVGIAHALQSVGIQLERDNSGKIEINPACVKAASAKDNISGGNIE